MNDGLHTLLSISASIIILALFLKTSVQRKGTLLLKACVSTTQSFHVSDHPLCALLHSGSRAAHFGARHQLSVAMKCRWSIDLIDDDDGHSGYLVDSGESNTTLTQDPRQSLRRKISPLC